MNSEKTILEAQSEIEEALHQLPQFAKQLPEVLKPLVRLAPPTGTQAQVSLRHARTERQVKRSAPADNWSPDSGMVSISYQEASIENESAKSEVVNPTLNQAMPAPSCVEDRVRDLVRALAKAEEEPQFGFVALKWFRDVFLPRQGYPWSAEPESRHAVLVEAISRKWILTSKVPNPKNPQFPVTAVKVNRPLAEVRGVLGQEVGFDSVFTPVSIAGEPLSETLLRERR
ncbi:MAG: hypothetical protein HY651_01710 [Acidobacteria bacterium]|nr:hypothetical protein [Acidobacteriota bacterium]